MSVSATALRKGAGEFVGWWLAELSALVPKPLLRAVRPVDRTISVTLDDTHITLTRTNGDSSEIIGRYATSGDDYDNSRHEIDRIITSHAPTRWRWGLYLDDNIVLRDLLRLPGAAIDNYREAVEFQIERQTPFRRDEVYFDCCPLAPAASTNLVGVEFIVARRDKVAAALQRVTAMGISVDFVTAKFDRAIRGAPFNLLPSSNSPRRRQPVGLNLALASLALLLGGLLVYLPLDHDRQRTLALSTRVDQLRTEAQVATRLRDQIKTEKQNILSVIDRKNETPPFIRILDDLTQLMPDEAWVSRLDYKDGTIRIVVHAPESGTIVRLIEGSDEFSNAQMVTAVRRQPNTGRERFTLSFSTRSGTPR